MGAGRYAPLSAPMFTVAMLRVGAQRLDGLVVCDGRLGCDLGKTALHSLAWIFGGCRRFAMMIRKVYATLDTSEASYMRA